jgi:hypothetical protein
MMLVGAVLFGADGLVKQFVANRIVGGAAFSPDAVALGVVKGNDIIGGVVYDHFTGFDIHATIAADSPLWARPKTLETLFGYPFNQLGCTRMTSLIKRGNKRSRRFCEGLGFKVEGVMRKAYGTSDGILYGLLKSECRFIGGNNG